jgi:hypothetical protein
MPTPNPPPKGGGWGPGVSVERRGYPRFEFNCSPLDKDWLELALNRHSRPHCTCSDTYEKVSYLPGTAWNSLPHPRNRSLTFVHISYDAILGSTLLSEVNPPKQVLDLLCREVNAAANVSGLRAEATWFLTIFSVSPGLPESIRAKALRHVMATSNRLWRGSSFGLRKDEQADHRAQAFWSDPSSGFIVVGSDSPFVAARQRSVLEYVAVSLEYKRLITPPPPTPIEIVVTASAGSPVQPSRCALSMAVKPFGALVKVARVGTAAFRCFVSPRTDVPFFPSAPFTVSITEVSNNPFIDLSRPSVLTITSVTQSILISSRDPQAAQVAAPSGTPEVIPPPSRPVMSETAMANSPPSPATTLDPLPPPSGGGSFATGPQPTAKHLKPTNASSSPSAEEASSSTPAGDVIPLVASSATTPHTQPALMAAHIKDDPLKSSSSSLPCGSPEALAFHRKDDLVSPSQSPAPQSGPRSAKAKKKRSPKPQSLADFQADAATTLSGASPPLKKTRE